MTRPEYFGQFPVGKDVISPSQEKSETNCCSPISIIVLRVECWIEIHIPRSILRSIGCRVNETQHHQQQSNGTEQHRFAVFSGLWNSPPELLWLRLWAVEHLFLSKIELVSTFEQESLQKGSISSSKSKIEEKGLDLFLGFESLFSLFRCDKQADPMGVDIEYTLAIIKPDAVQNVQFNKERKKMKEKAEIHFSFNRATEKQFATEFIRKDSL
jgi:hypothetical protein